MKLSHKFDKTDLDILGIPESKNNNKGEMEFNERYIFMYSDVEQNCRVRGVGSFLILNKRREQIICS